MVKKLHTFHIILIFFIILQCCFWLLKTSKIKPDFTITPLPPSKAEMSVFSFGDNELLYRIYGFQLQTAGDTFGETIPLKDYDYSKLEKWFYALNDLDDKSNYVPSIAGFYYSMSQNASDNKYIIDYLVSFADKNPTENWKWYINAMSIAKIKLKDDKKAFEIAKKMLEIQDKNTIPLLQKVIVLSLYNKKNKNSCEAVKMTYDLIKSGDLENLLKDETLSANGEKSIFYIMLKNKIDSIVKNKELLEKCLTK